MQANTLKHPRFQPSRYNHVFWADVKGQGMLQEVVVMAYSGNGSVWFIPVENLDNIDRQRMFKLINDRTSSMLPLYEIMSHVRLNNGINALEYFQQLVKFMAPNGNVVNGNTSMLGYVQQPAPQAPQPTK